MLRHVRAIPVEDLSAYLDAGWRLEHAKKFLPHFMRWVYFVAWSGIPPAPIVKGA